METELKKFWTANHLAPGDLWSDRDGVYVVISIRPANWRGDDRDVYAYIENWHDVRSATPEEIEIWQSYVAAAQAVNAQRKQLNAGVGYQFDAEAAAYQPTAAARRMLDSYDDRWTPPEPISLTPEQVAVELASREADSRIHGRPVSA